MSTAPTADAARAVSPSPRSPEILGTRSALIPGPDGPRTLETRNELLGSYPGMVGGKTGSTRAAGDCLAVAATRDGRRVLSVVLGSRAAATASRTLLDHAFHDYRPVSIDPGRPAGVIEVAGEHVPVEAGGWVRVLVPAGSEVGLVVEPFPTATAAFGPGAVVGVLRVEAGGEQVATTTLVLARTDPVAPAALGPEAEHVRERLAAVDRLAVPA